MGESGKPRGKAAQKVARGRRLSAALRENLRRRKAQSKGRASARAASVRSPDSHDSAGFAVEEGLSPDPRRPVRED